MSEKLLTHSTALTNIVRRIAEQAGDIILEYFDGLKDISSTSKSDGSPVTEADKQSESFIYSQLKELMPDIPVIGEEAYSKGERQDLTKGEYFWLVDPLDGTRSFIRGEEDFTVNIALIHKGNPVLGVVNAPAKEEIYCGYIDHETSAGNAFRYYENGNKEKSIKTRKIPAQGLCVMTSGSISNMSRYQEFLENYKVARITRLASSLKICAIARGKADLYLRLGSTGEWDTAAGHAILRAAGGDIRNLQGKPLRYGTGNKTMINPEFIAASNDFFSCSSL